MHARQHENRLHNPGLNINRIRQIVFTTHNCESFEAQPDHINVIEAGCCIPASWCGARGHLPWQGIHGVGVSREAKHHWREETWVTASRGARLPDHVIELQLHGSSTGNQAVQFIC